ncbi:tail protein X [Acerihabitans sp. TG2]|uniref:tail protein X n=1 Tax=Acerihabitans sp. TG2 TaxID=3096008 RepID=UPI002B23267E|nr:tail protein X [Acerihabitans sp. TG2]MEA9393492.1 tail protein X [Acerihabitans sp. TG2]
MQIYALQGDTVDAICWRYYGRTQGVVEQVLAVNPRLADLGAMLPHGTTLELPDIPDAAVIESLNLWD